jgi:NAD(P)-dependent dehydrogenase (short-subunit alcohol dehydrogenase family)
MLINNTVMHGDTSNISSTANLALIQTLLNTNLLGYSVCVRQLFPCSGKVPSSHYQCLQSGSLVRKCSHGNNIKGGINASYGIGNVELNAFIVKLADKLADSGILMNAICPGWTAVMPILRYGAHDPVPSVLCGALPFPRRVQQWDTILLTNHCCSDKTKISVNSLR